MFENIDANVIEVGCVIFVLLVAGIIALFQRRKGLDSAEKKRITEIIKEVTDGDLSLTAAFAYWTESETIKVNKLVNKYWYYAIGFNRERMIIVPIKISDERPHSITYTDFFEILPEQLGQIKKCGMFNSAGDVELYSREGNKLLSLKVPVSMTDLESVSVGRSGYRVNITQKEVAEKWKNEICPYWIERVNRANHL